MSKKKKILICPLDWGLGHAARCIPIIRELRDDYEIVIGADNRPFDLLSSEFPELKLIRIPGYDITYPRSGLMVLKMILQLPLIVTGMLKERKLVGKNVDDHDIDLVISDNRFGLWSRKVPCVYMTHQIMIKCPKWLRIIELLLYRIHRWIAEKYDECWIPDHSDSDSLAGDLTQRYTKPENAVFIGPLSRLKPDSVDVQNYDLTVVLSGPEPQRSIFEGIVIDQLKETDIKALIVSGKTEDHVETSIGKNIVIVSHLTTTAMNRVFASSKLILARPGYSTIMDLAKIGGKAVFVPTPGQTEQEYLADLYYEKGIFFRVPQYRLNLVKAIEEAQKFKGFTESLTTDNLRVSPRISSLLKESEKN